MQESRISKNEYYFILYLYTILEHCGYKSLLGFCLLSVKLFYPLVINHEIFFRFFYFSFVNKENSLHFISLQSISNQTLIPNVYTIYIYM